MTTLYRDGITEEEFAELFDISHGLLVKQKARRNRCVEELAWMGVKAIGPILYVMECDTEQDNEGPDDHEDFNQACFEVPGLDGEQRKNICRHKDIMGVEKEGRTTGARYAKEMEEEELE